MLIELPAAMCLRYFQPRYVFSLALIAFGTFAAIIPPTRSYGATMALRVLIGLGEAFTTNAFIFASLWYKPEELAIRIGELYCLLVLPYSDRTQRCSLWNDTYCRCD